MPRMIPAGANATIGRTMPEAIGKAVVGPQPGFPNKLTIGAGLPTPAPSGAKLAAPIPTVSSAMGGAAGAKPAGMNKGGVVKKGGQDAKGEKEKLKKPGWRRGETASSNTGCSAPGRKWGGCSTSRHCS